jgi:hypothetical protein
MIGDISPLIGRSFVAVSGNVATTRKLGPGGIGVPWRDTPTVEDAKEYDNWALAILGPDFEAHSERGEKKEQIEAYREWYRKTAK